MLAVLPYFFLVLTAMCTTTGCVPSRIKNPGFTVRFYEYKLKDDAGWGTCFFKSKYITKLEKKLSGVTEINFQNSEIPINVPVDGQIYGYNTSISNFALELSAFYKAPASGDYTFKLSADNGASLQFGKGKSCCNDAAGSVSGNFNIATLGPAGGGGSTDVNVQTATFSLQKGVYYPLKIVTFNWMGNSGLNLIVKDPSGNIIPDFGSHVFRAYFEKSLCYTTLTSLWTRPYTSMTTHTTTPTNTVILYTPSPTSMVAKVSSSVPSDVDSSSSVPSAVEPLVFVSSTVESSVSVSSTVEVPTSKALLVLPLKPSSSEITSTAISSSASYFSESSLSLSLEVSSSASSDVLTPTSPGLSSSWSTLESPGFNTPLIKTSSLEKSYASTGTWDFSRSETIGVFKSPLLKISRLSLGPSLRASLAASSSSRSEIKVITSSINVKKLSSPDPSVTDTKEELFRSSVGENSRNVSETGSFMREESKNTLSSLASVSNQTNRLLFSQNIDFTSIADYSNPKDESASVLSLPPFQTSVFGLAVSGLTVSGSADIKKGSITSTTLSAKAEETSHVSIMGAGAFKKSIISVFVAFPLFAMLV